MINNLDAVLQRLSEEPTPSRLAGTESIVLQRVADHSFGPREDSGRIRALAIVAALSMGIAGGLLPGHPEEKRPSLSPLGGGADLAPSSLLVDLR